MPCWSASTTSTTPVTYDDIMLPSGAYITIPMAELGLTRVYAVISYTFNISGNGEVSIKFYNLVSGGELVVDSTAEPRTSGTGCRIVDLTDFLTQGLSITLRVTLTGDGVNSTSCSICHISIYGVIE